MDAPLLNPRVNPDPFLPGIKKILKTTKKPYPITVATVVYPDGLVTLRVYQEEIMSYESEQRAAVLIYLEGMRNKIREFGVTCELEGIDGSPPKLRLPK